MKKRILSLLLALVLLVGLLPTVALATGTEDPTTQVHVIVENTTFLAPSAASDNKAPAWTGELVNEWITLGEKTLVQCINEALGNDYPISNPTGNYITAINGISERDNGESSGWMVLLNDWFINLGVGQFSATATDDNCKLLPGDEIRVSYTSTGRGSDLGGSFDNNTKTLSALNFSAGTLSPEFDSDTTQYTLTVPAGTTSVTVTPTATNKNFQVRTTVGGTEYKRPTAVTVENGTVINVKCGDPEWPSMNNQADGTGASVDAVTYTITVSVEDATTPTPSAAWDGETKTKPQTDSDGVYQISNGAELAWFVATSETTAKNVTISGKLTADIDLNNKSWVASTTSGKSQIIKLDGAGHKVTGLKSNLGLLGVISGASSEVKNLTVYGEVDGSSNGSSIQKSAGIVASFGNGTMENCINYVNVKGVKNVGGLIGYCGNKDVKILNCANYGSVAATTGEFAGGLVGQMGIGCTVTSCYNAGAVTGINKVGGLIGGIAQKSATITGCYNIGNISGTQYVGGLIGYAKGSSGKDPTKVNDCYNAGTVTGTSDTNFLFGKAEVADKPLVTTSGCVYLTGTGTDSYGTAKTEAQLKALDGLSSTYFKSSCGGYPAVSWQTAANHSPDGEGTVTPATCETGGYTTYTCSECKQPYQSNLTAALGHKYCEHSVDTTCGHCSYDPAATDTEDGNLKRRCQNTGCNSVQEDTVLSTARYEITLPSETGYTVAAVTGYTTSVQKGNNFCFTVSIDSNYKKSADFKVKANGTPLTETDGVYTITYVTEAQTVTVEGVVAKTSADLGVTIKAPAGSTISFGTGASYSGHQFATAIETTSDDSGVTAIYTIPGTAAFYRVQNPDGVTYWNFAKAGALKAGDVIEVTAEMLHIGDTGEDAFTKSTVYHDLEKNSFDVADLYLNINAKGYLNLAVDDTKQIYAVRNWQAIESYMNSEIAVPDVHYQVIDVNGSPSDIVTIEPDANKSMIATMTAKKAGTAIVLVTYDAMTDVTGQGGERFSAIWPENTGVFVVTVGAADSSSIQTNMTINERLNTVSGKLSVDALDAEHDVLYYLGTEGASYSFTPESGCTVEVLHPTLTASAMTYTNGFTTTNVSTNTATGEVTLSGLTTGTHIVKITKGDLVTYQLIRAKQASVSIVDGDGTPVELGGTVVAGTELKITYNGIYNPTEKLSGVYNFTPRLFYVDEDGNVTYSAASAGAGSYGFAASKSMRTFTYKISDFAESGTLTLNGGIATSAYGQPAGGHRGKENAGADLSASYREAQLGRLPTVTLQIQGREDLRSCTIRATDGTSELSSVTYTATNSEGESKTFTGSSFSIPVGTYTLTAEAEGYVVLRNVTIEVTDEGANSFAVTLTKAGKNPWDGVSFSAPQKDENGVWQISNGEELFWYATECNDGLIDGYNAVLTADIELAGHEFTAINNLPSGSTFDGKGYTIRNLYATYTSTLGSWNATKVGAFVNNCAGTIQNLTISGLYEVYTQNTTAAGTITLGAFAGNVSGTIQNCVSKVDISIVSLATAMSKVQVGGIAGEAKNLTDCINRGNITVDVAYQMTGSFIGGIVGIYKGTVERCANYGDITSKQYFANYIGGIAGFTSTQTAAVIDCYNAGKVTAEKANCAGGIVGQSKEKSTIKNCFNYGVVQANPQKVGQTVYISAISNTISSLGNVTVYTNNYYLTGSVPESYTGSAAGDTTSKEITADVEGQIEVMTATQFADGTVLAALNGEEGTVFGQRMGVDAYPVFRRFVAADIAAAEAVEALIEAIGTVTRDSGEAITAARTAYDALTATQKKLVENYDELIAAEKLFEQLNKKPTISVLPGVSSKPSVKEDDQTASATFTDVKPTDWYYASVQYAVEQGLMNGVGNGRFAPNAQTTRGMIVTVLARLEGVDTDRGSTWYAAGRQWAMEMGISDGTNMEGQITREQLATMLYRYAQLKGYDVSARASLDGFADGASISDWAKDAMQWAVAVGLMEGSSNSLTPAAPATRAQVAAILQRFLENVAK